MAKAKDDGENAKRPSALEKGSEAKKKDKNGENAKKPSPLGEGIKAGAIIGLFFGFGFLWLGYAPLASWTLGAIGGLAGGLIFGWWQITEEPEQVLVFEKRKTLAEATKERSAKQKQDRQTAKTTETSGDRRPKILAWLDRRFGKKDSGTGDE